jgi:hypothetical protein
LVATTVLDGIARERGDGGGDADGRGEQQREPSGDGTASATGGVGVGVDAAGRGATRGERRDRYAGTLRVRDADEREGARGGDDDAENADAGER